MDVPFIDYSASHVLAAIRVLNRLELVAETLRATLNALATVAPDWLQGLAPLAWYERYSRRIEDTRLPREQAQRDAYAQTVGEDGFHLLDPLDAPAAPQGLRELPIIATLRQTWQRHYERTARALASPGEVPEYEVRFKASRELPPAAEGIESPYDVEARYRHKRDTQWTGYPNGPGTWCTSAKRATPPPRTCLRTCTRPRPRCMKRSAPSRSSRPSSTRPCPRRSTSWMRPISIGVTCAVAYTYGCDDGRIAPTRCAIIDAGLDGR